jgi:hypothetical protein
MSATVVISVSEPAELRSLGEHLDRVPGVTVRRIPARHGLLWRAFVRWIPATTVPSGELGGWDVLQVAAASGGALVVAIKTLPAFIRSRRADVSITVRLDPDGGRRIELTAPNADAAVRLLEKALDA